jgi:hypothetical protein
LELSPDGNVEGKIVGIYRNVHMGLARLEELLPPLDEGKEGLTHSFWRRSTVGPRESRRRIAVPSWSEIRENYPATTRQALKELCENPRPWEDGRLILWNGPPGTGKSHALRALSWEWRRWADFNYVLDPSPFLFDPWNYMLSAFTGESSSNERWSVWVVEDVGDLLATDKLKSSGMSEMLNLSDGAVGQAMRAMILFTSNLDPRHLAAAVTRPGRCSVSIDFRPFEPSEAREWLRRSGSKATASGSVSLAELYATSRGRPLPEPDKAGVYL